MAKKIEITTTQKVTVEFELASAPERFVAFLVDSALFGIGYGILAFIITVVIFGGDYANYRLEEFFLYLVLVPYGLFFSLSQEIFFDGQTLGKRMTGIKIIKLNGTHPSSTDYIIRWAFRPIDIYASFGILAAILIFTSEKSQRFGDLAANTTIVKIRPNYTFSLKDILEIKQKENYVVTYTNANILSEKDVVLAKDTLTRYEKYKNPAHKEALYLLINKLGDLLELPEGAVQNGKESIFLRTLISDYIILTR